MNDVRFAIRQLLKNPGFTAVAVLTLALGIGANAAIFSVVSSVLLRPLPYPDSGRLVWLSERGSDWSGGPIAYPNFRDWREQQTVFEALGLYAFSSFALTGRDEPIQVAASYVSADVFTALRVQPAIGRAFTAAEDKPGGAPVVVLSHALWRDRFGGDANVVGRPITLDGRDYTVIGVMPSGFAFPSDVSLWAPVGPLSAWTNWQNRQEHPGLLAIARLKPEVTLEQARAEMDAIATRLEQQYPETNKTRRVQVDLLLDNQVGNVSRALWTLLIAVAVVLVIACANVANLLLARAATRQQEMAVRAALGAGRRRIIAQLLTESVLLAVLGGAAGLLLAQWGLHLILAIGHDSIPRVESVRLDETVLLFSAALVLMTGVLFGLAPAWQATRVDLQRNLNSGSRGTTQGRPRLRQALVVAEVALTVLLLMSAGLFLRSFSRLQAVNPGFAAERVLAFRVSLPDRKYDSIEKQLAFYNQLVDRLRSLPGVSAASVTSKVPLDPHSWDTTFLIDGRPELPPGERPSMDVQFVGPDYFRAVGIPVISGHPFSDRDDRSHLSGSGDEKDLNAGLNCIMIDEEFTRTYFPTEDPIGRRIRLPWGEKVPPLTIVGVVRRVKLKALDESGGKVQAYLPFLQAPMGGMSVVVKSAVPPRSLAAAARSQVNALDPELPVFDLHTLEELRNDSIAPRRLNLILTATFAGLALALAVIGLYGVLAHAVNQRRREIGVRVALGARRIDVLNLVVGQGMRLALLGVGLGLLVAVALTRLLRGLLFEIKPSDPLTFFVVTGAVIAVALLACWLPARRAANVDPMVAVRYE
jgi:putative ABC transport system permease protein